MTEAIAARRVKKKAGAGHGAGHVSEVVRSATHRGHRITVKTTYTIDMVKRLIDAFPDDLPPCPDCDAGGDDGARPDHDQPHHDGDHGGGH